jgi:nitroreductase
VSGLDVATVDHLLSTTRAVRRRLDLQRPVPREVITECLRLAVQAPTGTNLQLWRWLVVTDPETKGALAELYRNPRRPAAPAAAPAPDTAEQRRMAASVEHLREHVHEVPVLVIPCIYEAGAGAAGWPPSIYPAVWSFQLALRSRGLGSCITTVHLFRKAEAAELLRIPEGVAQACLIPVAYYTGDDFRPADRRPVEELTYWERWGNTDTSQHAG